ncbi:unnamed protein product [Lampetra fluviatilis]
MDFSESYEATLCSASVASRAGDSRLLSRLLRRGRPADAADNRGWRPLHHAAHGGHDRCVRLLLRAAPEADDVNAATFEEKTPLFLAAAAGHLGSVDLLLRAGAEPSRASSEEETPVFAAIGGGHVAVVKALLRNGAKVNGPQYWTGWTSLHQATWKGHVELLQLLLERGARVEARDDYGITPLFLAAQYGQAPCLRILLQHGPDVNAKSKDWATPLFIASQEGHTECLRLLLDNGAQPGLPCNEDGWQLPLHAAAQRGHVQLVSLLLPMTDASCGWQPGAVSPVYSATHGESGGCLRSLLEAGYSPDAQRCPLLGLESPLHLAISSGSSKLVDILLEFGASVTTSHLELSVRTGRCRLLSRLLQSGCALPSTCDAASRLFSREVCARSGNGLYRQWLPQLLLAGFDVQLLLRCPDRLVILDMGALTLCLEFTDHRNSDVSCIGNHPLPGDTDRELQHKFVQSAPPPCATCAASACGSRLGIADFELSAAVRIGPATCRYRPACGSFCSIATSSQLMGYLIQMPLLATKQSDRTLIGLHETLAVIAQCAVAYWGTVKVDK